MTKRIINLSLGSCFPTKDPVRAMSLGQAGVVDNCLGTISVEEVQICPQNGPKQLTEKFLDLLQEQFPETKFRLHANARLVERPVQYDLGTCLVETEYTESLVRLSKKLKTPYSIHAAMGKNAPPVEVQIERLKTLEDRIGVPVGVEGLYPQASNALSTWVDYEKLLFANVHFAIDLSHLNIVANCCTPPNGLVESLVASDMCMEVHVSGNDGLRDSHMPVDKGVWWLPLLNKINPTATIFYEGRQKT